MRTERQIMKNECNYRVIEFSNGEETPWRAVHKVYYHDGQPISYAKNSAVVGWYVDEGEITPHHILEQFRSALEKPILFERDFSAMMSTTLIDTFDGSGDQFLPLPDELMQRMGWQIGDVLDLNVLTDGLQLSRKESLS